jgi:hypothetical protein
LIDVLPVRRPQWIADPRVVLDVHLGTLARSTRLLGLEFEEDGLYHRGSEWPGMPRAGVRRVGW